MTVVGCIPAGPDRRYGIILQQTKSFKENQNLTISVEFRSIYYINIYYFFCMYSQRRSFFYRYLQKHIYWVPQKLPQKPYLCQNMTVTYDKFIHRIKIKKNYDTKVPGTYVNDEIWKCYYRVSEIHRKSGLHLLQYRFAVYLSRCITDFRSILGHSEHVAQV